MRLWVKCLSFMLASLCSALSAAPEAHAQSGKVIIVLDASGSMLGRVEGKAKIEIARAVIRDLLKSWDPRLELGIVAYGHRRKGDCTDIETLIPVGKADPAAVQNAVNRLRPKGKTPLSEAVRRAAGELKYTEDKATVILVSDGEETCNVDPCALGTQLEVDGVDFTAHVIGFGLKRDEDVGLRCLAENTGGEFVIARNAAALQQALGRTVTNVTRSCEKTPNLDGEWTYALCQDCPRQGAITIKQAVDRVTIHMRWTPNPAPGPHYVVDAAFSRKDCTLNGTWKYILTTAGYDQGGRYFGKVRPDGRLIVVSKTDDRGQNSHHWNGLVYYKGE